jgi:O-antigen ligase
MGTEVLLIVLTALAGAILVLLLPLVALRIALPSLVLLRALSDVGASSTGSLLPSSLISAALAGVAVVLAVIPYSARVGTRTQLWMIVLIFGIGFSVLIGAIHFGIDTSLISEALRLVSLIAVLIVAIKVGSSHPQLVPALVSAAVTVPALILIAGFAVRLPAMINGSGRAVGTFSHANSAAAYLSVGAIVMLGIWWFSRSHIAAVSGLCALIGLFLTQSLGGIIGFATAATVIVVISSGLSAARKVTYLIIAAALSLFLFTVSGVAERLDEFDTGGLTTALYSGVSDDSLGWRLVNWSKLLDVWAEQPFFGFGVGTTSSFVQPLGAPPHSLPVQLLVEVGVVGVLVLTLLVFAVVRRLNQYRSKGHWASIVLGLIVFSIVNGSESNLLGYTAAGYLMALAAGSLLGRMETSSALLKTPTVRTPTAVRHRRTRSIAREMRRTDVRFR